MVRKRRCSWARCLLLLLSVLTAGLIMLLWTIQHQRLVFRGPMDLRRAGHADTNITGLTSVAQYDDDEFDLGVDPFDASLRAEVLRNLTRDRIRLATLRGENASQVVFDPVSGVAMKKTDMQQYFEVRRKQEIRRNRPANRTEIQQALQLVSWRLNGDLYQLGRRSPPGGASSVQLVFLVTSWRSGSTFLGHVLSSHPAVFTHYEPLIHFGVRQARSKDDVAEAHRVLGELTSCRYNNLRDYMNYTRHNLEDMMSHNPPLWEACRAVPNRNTCKNETLLGSACRQFPVQVLKLVRLRLAEVERYLRSSERVRVLYLVRDPRATVSSRLTSVRWCRAAPECIQPRILCADLAHDLGSLDRLGARYPGQVRLVRYEQLSKDPLTELRDIFTFLDFPWTERVEKVVRENTDSEDKLNQPWSVKKKSAEHINRWRNLLTNKQLAYVNRKCRTVMEKLDYPIL